MEQKQKEEIKEKTIAATAATAAEVEFRDDGLPISDHEKPENRIPLSTEEQQRRDEYNQKVRKKFLEDQAQKPVFPIWVNVDYEETDKDNWQIIEYKYHALTTGQRYDLNKARARVTDLQFRFQKVSAIIAIATTNTENVKLTTDDVKKLQNELNDISNQIVEADYDFSQKRSRFYFKMPEAHFRNSKYDDLRDMGDAAEYRESMIPLSRVPV